MPGAEPVTGSEDAMSAITGAGRETMLSAAAVRGRPRQPFQGLRGVEHATLWSDGDDYAGLLWLEPGSHIPEHSHEHACHHVWVVDGAAVVEGQPLAAGSYWYIPPGCLHRVQASTSGCQLFYLYLHTPARSQPTAG
jgi:mannose-6-phosphate isomerase-like protein (cupin superfamily)